MLEAERQFLRPHRPDRSGRRDVLTRLDRRLTEVDGVMEKPARARARHAAHGDLVEVGIVQRIVVRQPLVAAERPARHVELEDVVEDAPRAVDLRAPIALQVVGEAGPWRGLVAPPALDLITSNITA